MTYAEAEREIKLLVELIERRKQRAMTRYMESGNWNDMIEGQRAIGAHLAVEDLRRRLRCLAGEGPEWVRRHLSGGQLELRPMPASSDPGAAGIRRKTA